jgi:carboxylesterase
MIYVHPQAEPFFLRGNDSNALLMLHGFTASPSELYPSARLLNELGGLTVSGILLPGHGSSPRDLKKTGWKDWYRSVEDEACHLLEHYERVFVAGLSLGGLLALHAAVNIPGFTGVISINAPLYTHYPLLTATAPLLRVVKPYFPKKSDRRQEQLYQKGRFAYDVMPVRAFRSMQQLRALVMEELADIEIPLMVVQSLQDESVHPRSADYILKQAVQSQSKLLELAQSEHIATMGPEKEILVQAILQFIQNSVQC